MGGIAPHKSSIHHTGDRLCPKCEITLVDAHPEFIPVWKAIKEKFTDAHISWSYRDQASQEEAVKEHKSNAHFPYSPHNKTDKNGKPCSHAIDLFVINFHFPEGGWPEPWFKEVADYIEAIFPFVFWGGKFKSIHDGDHYEIEFDAAGNPVIQPPKSDGPVVIPAKRKC